jgi:hypothetical protein
MLPAKAAKSAAAEPMPPATTRALGDSVSTSWGIGCSAATRWPAAAAISPSSASAPASDRWESASAATCLPAAARSRRVGQRLAGEFGDIVGEPAGQLVQDADRRFQALPREKALLGQSRCRSEPARGRQRRLDHPPCMARLR